MYNKISRDQIYDILREQRLITEEQVIDVEQHRYATALNVEEALTSLDILSEDDLLRVLGEYLNIPYVQLNPMELDTSLTAKYLSAKFARMHHVVVVDHSGRNVTIAVPSPFEDYPLADIENATGAEVDLVLSSRRFIDQIINMSYGLGSSITAAEKNLKKRNISTRDYDSLENLFGKEVEQGKDPNSQPIITAVNHLLFYAFEQRASDIHLEPKREECIVRFRIDGVLHSVYYINRLVYRAIVSRIKVMAGMNIAEKRRPQDGRIKIVYKGQEVELRVSTVATAFGEKLVLRIFDPDILLQDLGSLGFGSRDLKMFNEFIHATNGMVLVTGPTGSGKTTTLYSALREIYTPEINICTIEDPIELVYEPLNQVAVRPEIDVTFANVLRTMLRQDPDVIMVGEIRDKETATYAIQAALTGHLVLSTLHTNDAPSAITRLIDMGVPPFLIASTMRGSVAQRLVRKICDHCKTSYRATSEDLKPLNLEIQSNRIVTLYYGKGVKEKGYPCLDCRETGYFGRSGIYEVMAMSESLRNLTKENASTVHIRKQAIKEGMVSMRQNALRKLLDGVTTVEEVAKIIAGI
ncbi:MAG: type II/IV secretion system protein [Gemmatimonadetes bacterium]|nr:MAG: type II/IV secretion system protein [Gemmatimonadota bacterium]